jgi:hypothetical protein
LLLQFATASVVESLRSNPEIHNIISYTSNNYITTYGSNSLSLMLPEQQQLQQRLRYINNDPYAALILEEAEKLYNEVTTKLTNEIMAAATMETSSLSFPTDNNKQNLTHENMHIK